MAVSKSFRLWLAIGSVWSGIASAEVTRIEIGERTDLANAAAFGAAGPYEKIRGTLHFAVDRNAAANDRIADIALAPSNPTGAIEFRADFYLLKPKDIELGNGALLLEVANRGGKGAVRMFNLAPGSLDPTTAERLGDGFLLEQGFTLLWVGWQLDVPSADPDLLRVYPPVVPVTGLVRSDFVVRAPGVRDHSLGDGEHVAYPVADPTSATHTLTVRDDPVGARTTIPRDAWQFARVDGSGNVVPDSTRVYLSSGFEPKRIYEVVYTAANAPLAGLGLAAIRDSVSFLKHDGAPELGIERGSLDRAIGFGISQSGRVLRTFLYEGFNQDERQRRVFDGVLAHIAGGARGGFNTRFAQPSRASSSFLFPNDVWPFSDAAQTDAVSGSRDGLLAHVAPEHVPKIFYTNSSNEYWRGHAALTHVTVDGARDLPPGERTRIYLFAGTQHGPAQFPPRVGAGQLPDNPNSYAWFMRALLVKLDDWVARDAAPPPSRYPTLAQRTLVTRSELAFPSIPNVALPRRLHAPVRLDFGPRFAANGVATVEPPNVGAAFPTLLPQVDADGNELAGLRSPELAAPLATYMGWALYDPGIGRDDELVSLQGSFAPLPLDAAERQHTGDPRRAILERYTDRAHYLTTVEQAARPLVAEGYVLARDLPAILRDAEERWRVLVAPRTQR